MPEKTTPSIFRQTGPSELVIGPLEGGLDNTHADINIDPGQLSGGENMIIDGDVLKKRGGKTLFRQFLGTGNGVDGGFNFVNQAATQLNMVVWNGSLYYDNGTQYTILGSIALTAGKPCDGAYFPFTNKFYIVNQTDNVAKITSSGTSDQSDSSFKQGKYIASYQNRLLVANTTANPNRLWYSDNQLDTFTSTSWVDVDGVIVGIKAMKTFFLIWTKTSLYRLDNFVFDGTGSWVNHLYPLPTPFGSVYERTIIVLNNYVYFLGQDARRKACIYKTDGYSVTPLSDEQLGTQMDTLSSSQLITAAAIDNGVYYELWVPESGQTTNNIAIRYNTVYSRFEPAVRNFVVGIADISCLWRSESNGQWQVYAGTSGTGQVYVFNSNDGLYDELPEERYLTAGTYNVPIDANPAKRAAQSFQLHNYPRSMSISVNKIAVNLKKNAGTTTDLTVRIETDNNGLPSGTLVTNGSATITAFSSTSYAWYTATFNIAPILAGTTKYWLVIEHITEGMGNSQYFWLGNTCSPTYSYGNLGTYTTGKNGATVTLTPGTNIITGRLERSANATTGESWATIVAGAGSFNYTPDLNMVIDTEGTAVPGGNFTNLERSVFLFDTTTIPAGATIVSATVSLYCTVNTNTFAQSLNITSSSPASNTALVPADYNVANYGSTRFTTDFPQANLSLNAYNTFTLNSAGRTAITKAGITKFALRYASDIDNSAPLWQSNTYHTCYFTGGNAANAPQLVVAYTTAGGVAGWSSDPITDQNFVIYPQSAIDAFMDTYSAQPSTLGRDYKLHKFMAMFSTVGPYSVEVGFSDGIYNTFRSYLVSLSSAGNINTWGGGGKWGTGLVWGGGPTRNFAWKSVNGFQGKLLKVRARNRNPNQQFKFNAIRIVYNPKLRSV